MSSHVLVEMETDFSEHTIYPLSLNQLVMPVRTFGPYLLHPQTEEITVRLARHTTAAPRNWDSASRVRVTLTVTAPDGTTHPCVGHATGGIRTDKQDVEIAEYHLTYKPTWGFWGATTGNPKRMGDAAGSLFVTVELAWESGTIETEGRITASVKLPPALEFHNSVAFDAATDASEVGGDGVLSVSHTATGSNRAAFLGSGNAAGTPSLGSSTYGGSGMTEMWDAVFGTFYAHAGYYFVAPSTSATTVTNTLAAGPSEHAIGVITMTDVDQSTTVGTPATATGLFGTLTVTAPGVAADDMVVDSAWGDSPFGTIGADQTERNTETPSSLLKQSTQPGTAGGVMSWGDPISNWGTGAVAFKVTASGGRTTKNTRGFPLGVEVGMGWRMAL